MLIIAACFSLPDDFVTAPDIGLDPSWRLSLQMAVLKHEVFGRDFVFTYGPLGWLIIHAALSKALQLFYDLFLLCSLLSIYRRLLPERTRLRDALLLVALAVVTKPTLDATAVLFTVLCHWLWRVYDQGEARAVGASLIAAVLLFFGKVNYGMIMTGLLPAYGIVLILLHRQRRWPGLWLLLAFPTLVWLGSMFWHVDLPGYLRSGAELIVGYNEAMFHHPANTLFVLGLASLYLLGMAIVAVLGRRRLPWRGQAMVLLLPGLAILLLFKNGFVRCDEEHTQAFFEALPLLLALWCITWRGHVPVYCLLAASLVFPVIQVAVSTTLPGGPGLGVLLPVNYLTQALTAPWRLDAAYLERSLRVRYPEAILPDNVGAVLGRSSVDVMPWESSLAIENGLNYRGRPIPQSYTAYTPWLDRANVRFLDSTNAPDWLMFTYGAEPSVDTRPAIWDESLTKMALLEQYDYDSQFTVGMREDPPAPVAPAAAYLMKRTAHPRRFVPVATNEVSLSFGQILAIPPTTNLVFLTLEVNRSKMGKLMAAATWPATFIVTFHYEGDLKERFRAIRPILTTGVLVNRRVEALEETANWLKRDWADNPPVTAVSFNTPSQWTYQPPFKGRLVEYRLTDQ